MLDLNVKGCYLLLYSIILRTILLSSLSWISYTLTMYDHKTTFSQYCRMNASVIYLLLYSTPQCAFYTFIIWYTVGIVVLFQLFFKKRVVDEEGYILFVRKNAIQILIPKYGLEATLYLNTDKQKKGPLFVFNEEVSVWRWMFPPLL